MAEETTTRGPGRPRNEDRPDMRPAMRADDPRARAEARTAQLLDHIGDMDEGTDDFYVDLAAIPDGWSYEWKRKTLLNQEDPSYQVQIARNGWEPVPANRHPEYMPQGWTGATIERKGLVLMERPKKITDMVRDRDYRAARNQVRQKEEQLSSAAPGQFERVDATGRPTPRVSKSYEPMQIPKD